MPYVSTPLPSGKVCDIEPIAYEYDTFHVSTPLPSGKVCDEVVYVNRADWETMGFQHLYLLGRSATRVHTERYGLYIQRPFQHLYLLGRSATFPAHFGCMLRVASVSTPLPSGKVCDFLVTNSLREAAEMFQHLYLLGRSATRHQSLKLGSAGGVSTPLPSGKVCDLGSPTGMTSI